MTRFLKVAGSISSSLACELPSRNSFFTLVIYLTIIAILLILEVIAIKEN